MVGGAAEDGGELPAGGRERPIPALVSQERFLLTVEGGQDQLVDTKGAVGAAGRGPAAQQRDQEAGGQAATYQGTSSHRLPLRSRPSRST